MLFNRAEFILLNKYFIYSMFGGELLETIAERADQNNPAPVLTNTLESLKLDWLEMMVLSMESLQSKKQDPFLKRPGWTWLKFHLMPNPL